MSASWPHREQYQSRDTHPSIGTANTLLMPWYSRTRQHETATNATTHRINHAHNYNRQDTCYDSKFNQKVIRIDQYRTCNKKQEADSCPPEEGEVQVMNARSRM
ncbi:hypothetical protein TSAR_003462 [Trichomalopsis sarcophagae]|uniref:Uncharacterized protein n=1 Tax=Trichomalopsis sarcophagae TaxID=543379 RepID=A0A232EEL1_9HYME|nr:hypothetical protein TSAR_003462 [Trichomalopsis sarcophagae]